MKKFFSFCVLFSFFSLVLCAEEFVNLPSSYKWLDNKNVIFSYDGSYEDSDAFVFALNSGKKRSGVKSPEKYVDFPLKPEAAVNLCFSPDSSMLAYTRDNDLYVTEIASGKETRLTFDGTDLILNGYASWVYFEEIFGRPSKYRAFWWSPDSKKILFYRFDNSEVTLFPIFSPFGQNGSLNNTRYPKAGQKNPDVRIGCIDLETADHQTVWAEFDYKKDGYFGTPFWGPDSKEYFISRMPRTQNTLEVFSVSASDGSKERIYEEHYPTWLDWIEGMIFTDKGLYMARAFETGWQQIYFLSYDGKTFRRLTDGPNWEIELLRVEEKSGTVFFLAKRDESTHPTVYSVDEKGLVKCLSNPGYWTENVVFSPDGKHFAATYSNARTPRKVAIFDSYPKAEAQSGHIVADMAGDDYNPEKYALPQPVTMKTPDGFVLPGLVTFPKSLEKKTGLSASQLASLAVEGCAGYKFPDALLSHYPVHFLVYGGPGTKVVRDRWSTPSDRDQWWSDNDIIHISVDPRSAGHNGRAGMDLSYRRLSFHELEDYVAWAKWMAALPYVKPEKTGVEGFSFGGTSTVTLLCEASEYFHYGIAGGGVYDWNLYDTHYTERFMDTPQNNPDGYKDSAVLSIIDKYPVTYDNADGTVMLKLTHGTGDDNVHFQNTLQLIDKLQKSCKKFEFMIYPDALHGYRGLQDVHDNASDHEFWRKYLLDK